MKTVLFVNHAEKNCGVYQYGAATHRAFLAAAARHRFVYLEAANVEQFAAGLQEAKPDLVIFNWCGPTTPWVTPDLLLSLQGAEGLKVAMLVHDTCCPYPQARWHIHVDPTAIECNGHFSVPRPVQRYRCEIEEPKELTFGTFGFAFNHKVRKLVELVGRQFDKAIVRVHMPFAHYGDHEGRQARARIDEAKRQLKPGIELQVDHEFLDHDRLLGWLARNTCNCFLYDTEYGRGPASVTDYAMAVPRPIALTRSYQFRHIPELFNRVEQYDLRTIISAYQRIKSIYKRHDEVSLCRKYESIVDEILGSTEVLE